MNIKLLFITAILLTNYSFLNAQNTDSDLIKRAGFNYIEGFYEGDTLKLKDAISDNLFKFGYWKSDNGEYAGEPMTYTQALDYAKGVMENKRFVSSEAPKIVEILDVQEHIAAIKLVAWWGLDYALLSKKDGTWKIDQVLWQGPIHTIKQ